MLTNEPYCKVLPIYTLKKTKTKIYTATTNVLLIFNYPFVNCYPTPFFNNVLMNF